VFGVFTFERFSPRTTKLDPEMAIERTDECVEVVATVDVCAAQHIAQTAKRGEETIDRASRAVQTS